MGYKLVNCFGCGDEFRIKESRLLKSKSGHVFCSRECSDSKRTKRRNFPKLLKGLLPRYCECGCGQLIFPKLIKGKVVFDRFIWTHNWKTKEFREIGNKAKKDVCSQKMKEYNESLSIDEIKRKTRKSGRTMRRHVRSGQLIRWNKGRTKKDCESLKRASEKQKGRKVWNSGKTKFTDKRLKRVSNKAKKRTKKNGYISAYRSSARMKSNNPMFDLETKLRALTRYNKKPNRLEQKVADLNIPNLQYTGDFSFWITLENKKFKNPDFIVKPFHIEKKVVEVWGKYWHKNDNGRELKKLYKRKNIRCLILKEEDINKGLALKLISRFLNE